MKKEISVWQGWFAFIFFVAVVVWVFWHFSDPVKYHYSAKCYIEKGWYINRRFGEDIYLGDIKEENARKLSGNNIIYYSSIERCS